MLDNLREKASELTKYGLTLEEAIAVLNNNAELSEESKTQEKQIIRRIYTTPQTRRRLHSTINGKEKRVGESLFFFMVGQQA